MSTVENKDVGVLDRALGAGADFLRPPVRPCMSGVIGEAGVDLASFLKQFGRALGPVTSSVQTTLMSFQVSFLPCTSRL